MDAIILYTLYCSCIVFFYYWGYKEREENCFQEGIAELRIKRMNEKNELLEQQTILIKRLTEQYKELEERVDRELGLIKRKPHKGRETYN